MLLLLPISVGRPVYPLMTAPDASLAFGFWVSVRAARVEVPVKLCSASVQHGFYVTLDEVANAKPRSLNVGSPARLPFDIESFAAFPFKAGRKGLVGELEAHALLLVQ